MFKKNQSIQEFTAVGGRNRYGLPFHKLDIKKQIFVLIDLFGSDHQIRNKGIGNATKKARIYVVFQFVENLKHCGYPIKNILNLDQRHIKAAVSVWKDENLSASTIQNRFTTLRWLSTSIGKDGLILAPEKYGITPEEIKRTYVATVDKSWTGNDVIPSELIAKATIKDKWVGMQLELMDAFGMRIKESLLIRPKLADNGPNITIEEGTKGGRTRVVPVRNDSQRDVLDRAILLSKESSRGAMIPPGKDLKQAMRRAYYICKLVGITRDQLAITPHGLRHQYANDLYEQESGMPTTLRGTPSFFDTQADIEARTIVTKELGHARLRITGAYTGATRTPGRPPLNPRPPKSTMDAEHF